MAPLTFISTLRLSGWTLNVQNYGPKLAYRFALSESFLDCGALLSMWRLRTAFAGPCLAYLHDAPIYDGVSIVNWRLSLVLQWQATNVADRDCSDTAQSKHSTVTGDIVFIARYKRGRNDICLINSFNDFLLFSISTVWCTVYTEVTPNFESLLF